MTTSCPLLVSMPGSWEWIVILLVVLVFFGRRIPGVARSLGSGISEFKRGLREGEGGAEPGKGGEALPPPDDTDRDKAGNGPST